MSTELDHAREIAERIARRVASEPVASERPLVPAHAKPELTSELASVRAGLSELQRKLAQLEAKLGSDAGSGPSNSWPLATAPPTNVQGTRPVLLTHSPWLAGVNAGVSHPSQEKFGVAEAVISDLVDYFEKEKICTVEPGGKPCDHCAMCSSRGF
ncbi:MAG: hypothetical protein QOJ88_666 [Pyrinomonadaceae bacterium]|jgi:ribosomal protein RSM22 (predicted rRNA methylase)|nr:hypothetical protein [Pyrinomonadaceae bacterium]